jgi:pyruvate/2-oxoglutarate dehydrogenase complex dihydrolipoamide acyltransferase (E2) component
MAACGHHDLESRSSTRENDMDVEVKLPDLGKDAPNEATLSFFYFEVGQEVKEGDDFAEFVTDKASFSVPSPVTGKVKKLLLKEGDVLKVGKGMAIVETG